MASPRCPWREEAKVAAQVRTDQWRCSQSRAASLERLSEFAGHEANRACVSQKRSRGHGFNGHARPHRAYRRLLRPHFGNAANCKVPPRREQSAPIKRQTLGAPAERTLLHCLRKLDRASGLERIYDVVLTVRFLQCHCASQSILRPELPASPVSVAKITRNWGWSDIAHALRRRAYRAETHPQ